MNALVQQVRATTPTALRFLAVGASSIVVNSAVLWMLHDRMPLVLAAAIATEAAILYCYLGHEWWTFRSHHGGRLSLRRLRDYHAVTLIGLLITVGSLQILVTVTSLHLLVANLFAIGIATTWNFTMSRVWAFRRRS